MSDRKRETRGWRGCETQQRQTGTQQHKERQVLGKMV